MKYERRVLLYIVYLVVGVVLFACGLAGVLEEFWSGLGGAFIGMAVMQLVRCFRYRTNEQYRQEVDVAVKDERNKFLSNKAWAWAGYWFVLIAAVGTIVFKLLGREELMMLASCSVCLMILLYWCCWLYLRKKY